MSDLERVLERILEDDEFAAELRRDPASALAGYSLTPDDVAVLGASMGEDPGALQVVEQRLNKATLTGLVSSVVDVLGHHPGAGHETAAGQRPGAAPMRPEPAAAPTFAPPSVSGGLAHAQDTLTALTAHGEHLDAAMDASQAEGRTADHLQQMQELMKGMMEQSQKMSDRDG